MGPQHGRRETAVVYSTAQILGNPDLRGLGLGGSLFQRALPPLRRHVSGLSWSSISLTSVTPSLATSG